MNKRSIQRYQTHYLIVYIIISQSFSNTLYTFSERSYRRTKDVGLFCPSFSTFWAHLRISSLSLPTLQCRTRLCAICAAATQKLMLPNHVKFLQISIREIWSIYPGVHWALLVKRASKKSPTKMTPRQLPNRQHKWFAYKNTLAPVDRPMLTAPTKTRC